MFLVSGASGESGSTRAPAISLARSSSGDISARFNAMAAAVGGVPVTLNPEPSPSPARLPVESRLLLG